MHLPPPQPPCLPAWPPYKGMGERMDGDGEYGWVMVWIWRTLADPIDHCLRRISFPKIPIPLCTDQTRVSTSVEG